METENKEIKGMRWIEQKYRSETWFEEKYKRSINDLKNEIAKKSITFSNNNYDSLIVREIRGRDNLIIDYHYKDEGSDGFSDYKRFKFEFPICHYSLFPSAVNVYVWNKLDGGFYIGNKEGDVIKSLSEEKLIHNFVEDLIIKDFNDFNEIFEVFLIELYNWHHVKN